jgi:hypothetical protein
MKLDPECEAIILRAARRVPDALRDNFFWEVATRLKFLRHITETDVRHTSAAVLFVVGVLLPCRDVWNWNSGNLGLSAALD